MSKKAFIIGQPISHSLSPKLHGFWLNEYGIDGSYEAINVPPKYLVKTVRKLSETGYVGGNVTIPHKEKVMMVCDEVDELARKVGAVNTLHFKNGKILGSNSDVYGFMENVRPALARTAFILGAGGAARGIIVGLRQQGIKVTISNRTLEKSECLAKEFDLEVSPWQEKNFENIELLVNTTSIGMKGKDQAELDISSLPKSAAVVDIVYNPLKTPLLKAAEEKGCKIIDGLGMLMHQAVPGFEKWFGKKPQVTEELREYLIKCL